MIIRSKPTRDYSVVKNAIINHAELQPLARLTLIYVLSKPDDWKVRMSNLRAYLQVGREKMRAVMANLEACG